MFSKAPNQRQPLCLAEDSGEALRGRLVYIRAKLSNRECSGPVNFLSRFASRKLRQCSEL